MKPSFDIRSSITDTAEASLFIEISLHGMAYLILNGADCMALSTYHFPAGSSGDDTAIFLKDIVSQQRLLQQGFRKVNIIYAYPMQVLVPHAYFKDELKKDMLELLDGDVQDVVIKNDFMYRHQLHNIYSVPRQVDSTIDYLFSADCSTHEYSLLPDVLKEEGNHLYCIFNSSYFTVMLLKEGTLQVMQSFEYKTPEDVAYYLLQLCESFDVLPSDIIIHLNGMIAASSNLYNELNKYFLHLQFEKLPDNYIYPEAFKDYPEHFFSHLFALALCV